MNFLEKIDYYSNTNKVTQIYNDEKLTYSELKEKSDAIACFLIEKLGNDKQPILVYGHKDNYIIPCFLGCSKSGHAYIPIDTTFPVNRVYDIMENSNSKIIFNFSQESLKCESDVQIIDQKLLVEIFDEFKNKTPNKDYMVKENELVYVLYTSGSTGKPKGVKITRECIENFIKCFEKFCTIENENGVFMNQVSYSFDVSVISLYIGLSNGRTLYVIDKNMISNFQELFNNFSRSNISLWISTPSFLEMCILDSSFNAELMPNLEKILVAGEVLTKNLTNKIFDRFPQVKLINGYGPTEATVLATAVEITKDMLSSDESLPIGYAGENIILKIKDLDGKDIDDDCVKGELNIFGESVSTGYYGNEEITKKAFYKEYINGKELRGYKTGDIVYKNRDLFYYCARKDFQIKLNGFRIELQDIEKNLLKISFIENAVVLPVEKDNKIVYLSAFVKLNEELQYKNSEIIMKIKQELKNLIPVYMVPRKIKIKDKFKLNVNGKIDRKALQEEL